MNYRIFFILSRRTFLYVPGALLQHVHGKGVATLELVAALPIGRIATACEIEGVATAVLCSVEQTLVG